MLLRLQNSVTSMNALVRQQERVANNLANANTVGYKRDRAFTEALDEHLDEEGAPRSERLTQHMTTLEQGALEQTGNPLDIALGSEGFFVLLDEATGSERYTRAGRFTVGDDGLLRTLQGQPILGTDGPIKVPAGGGALEISQSGEIHHNKQPLGKLKIVTFDDPAQLQRLDGAAFAAPGNPPQAAPHPIIKQGFVEGSNVNPIKEMTEMITHFRTFEAQQKLIQTTDQILGLVTRDLGKF
jgi:flagellar basal-body rod protein FlgF/flagellar basal-body rod protein FlgG